MRSAGLCAKVCFVRRLVSMIDSLMSSSWGSCVRSMSGNKVVAIHQPTVFPWLGYCNKIARCDQFVVLDSVQFPKKGGTWSNRVKILLNGNSGWLTMPVDRNYHGVRSYAEMNIDNGTSWRDKLVQTIRTNYGATAHFAEVFPSIEELIRNPTTGLTDYNLSAILYLAKALEVDTGKIVLASETDATGAGTDLLISFHKGVKGTASLCLG